MRCLRCALDYPAEERYCHRCGRALSRPPGSREPDESSQFSALQDTQYLYSTFSPPGAGGSVQARAGLEDEPAGAAAPAPWSGFSSSAALVSHPSEMRMEAAPDEHDLVAEIAGPEVDGRETSSSLPGGGYLPPQSELNWPAEPEVKLTRPVDDFDDEEDVLAAFRVKPAAIGDDSGTRRRRSSRQQGMEVLPQLPRRAGIAIIALVVLVIGGAAAFWRHGIYASDLRDAQNYAQAGQFSAAIGKYQDAISAWPLNTGAKDGLAGVQATVVVANATATAVVVNAQAQATAIAERQSIYAARLHLRKQGAAQSDADANATATASSSH